MESSVKKKIEHYCAYQERCHLEVTNKLNKLGVFGDELDEYVCYLIDENFLSETRFSEAYVRGKFNNNNWGKVKLSRELKLRNISDWNISNALNQIKSEDYNKKLRKLCEKLVEISDKPEFELRNKVVKNLSYKGWEIDLIIKTLNQLIR
ncbi:MAG: RecX family transcriptional regulator [Cryomorphaceae bacterium]|nr:RecX family transcriptional regulator [Cryomorphaceae bacterium]